MSEVSVYSKVRMKITYTGRDFLTTKHSTGVRNYSRQSTRDSVAETKTFFDHGMLIPSAP